MRGTTRSLFCARWSRTTSFLTVCVCAYRLYLCSVFVYKCGRVGFYIYIYIYIYIYVRVCVCACMYVRVGDGGGRARVRMCAYVWVECVSE